MGIITWGSDIVGICWVFPAHVGLKMNLKPTSQIMDSRTTVGGWNCVRQRAFTNWGLIRLLNKTIYIPFPFGFQTNSLKPLQTFWVVPPAEWQMLWAEFSSFPGVRLWVCPSVASWLRAGMVQTRAPSAWPKGISSYVSYRQCACFKIEKCFYADIFSILVVLDWTEMENNNVL